MSAIQGGTGPCRDKFDMYICTLPKGHTGNHVAEGQAGNIYLTWEQPCAGCQKQAEQIAALREALVGLRALVIAECGASAYECVDGERADAILARTELATA